MDTTTLIPFIKSMENFLYFKYFKISADAGYESEEGCVLRMNRSIQAEGSFAEIKHDMGFRRYLSKGKKNVLAESILLAMAHNINKLHNKIQSDRTGIHLFPLKKSA